MVQYIYISEEKTMILNDKPSKENMKKLKKLYERTFPRAEKKPFSLIVRLAKEGKTKIYAAEENGEFLGLAIMVMHSGVALLDYLAIEENRRNKGVGGQVIEALKVIYKDSKFILEIEDTDKDIPEREMRMRRKKFYLSHGLLVMPYKICLFGVDMEVLCYGGEIDFDEYHAVYSNVFPKRIPKRITLL